MNSLPLLVQVLPGTSHAKGEPLQFVQQVFLHA